MARRRERPLLVVDLALPRDVDPAVRALPNVTLVDLDGLQTMVAEALAERRRHLPEVERLVGEEVERFLRETSARAVSPLVSALRCRVEEVRRAELARWQGRLNELDPGAAALAETITAGVVAKLLHAPTVRLRDAAGTADAALYHDALVELFDLAISSPPGGTREYAA
jgi:glutamyl-tRNA reductase